MEGVDSKGDMKGQDGGFNQDVYSKVVRAGKRTYFFDVKSTRNEDLYLTITESKKHFDENGNFHYEKHKIFLYREDFEKFSECLQEIVAYIGENQEEPILPENSDEAFGKTEAEPSFSKVDFEDI